MKINFKFATPVFVIGGIIISFLFNSQYDLILLLTLLIGLIPLFWDIAISVTKGKFGIDLIALCAIIGSILLGEFLAGIVILLMLSGGEALEAFALKRARDELKSLISNAPAKANLIIGNEIREVKVSELKVGDIFLVKPSEVVAADGIIVSGESFIDESSLTGESLPVLKKIDDDVLSGSLNADGIIKVKVLKESRDSKYQQIIRLVREAQENKAPFVRLADHYSVVFTLITFALAILAYAVSDDFSRVLAVLVVATPCPLIIAPSVAFAAGISRAAKKGIIVKSGGVLEVLAKCSILIFDKTGTLTKGFQKIVKINSIIPEKEAVKIAYSLEQFSTHVLSKSFIEEAKMINPVEVEDFKEKSGFGISGKIYGEKYFLGKKDFLKENNINLSNGIEEKENVQDINVYLANQENVLVM